MHRHGCCARQQTQFRMENQRRSQGKLMHARELAASDRALAYVNFAVTYPTHLVMISRGPITSDL